MCIKESTFDRLLELQSAVAGNDVAAALQELSLVEAAVDPTTEDTACVLGDLGSGAAEE